MSQSPVPSSSPRQSVTRSVTQTELRIESWQGPLPPPETLRAYNEIIPDGAVRIFDMLNRQVDHRIALESAHVRGRLTLEKRGQIFAFVLGAGGIGLGALGMITGYGIVGLAAFITSIASLVGTYLYGSRSQREERERKAEIMAEQQPRR